MRSPPVVFMAARFFVGRRDEAGSRDQARKALAGAVLSIALSLVPLITVMQVADGMIQGITARYVELGTYHAEAYPYMASDLEAGRDAAAAAPGVTGAWLETQSVGVALANGRKEGAAVRGVEQGFLDDESTRRYLELEAGDLELERSNEALVGSAMARKLGLSPGDSLSLITVRKGRDGQPVPRVNVLVVSGIVSAGYRELDAQWLFMRQDAAARLLPKDSTRSFIGIKAGDPFGDPNAAVNAVSGSLPPGYSIYSWKDVERNLFESLSSTRTMLLLIMAVTVAVAAVNVSSSLTTLVLERRQEIAVMKSLGAAPGDLVRVFCLGGAAIGAAGAVLGAAGGLLTSLNINAILAFVERCANAARNLVAALSGARSPELWKVLDPEYYLESIPVGVPFGELAAVVAATVFLSFLAALGPAWRAALLSPLEGVRKR